MKSSVDDHLGNYHVYWKFNQTHITFEVHVKTRGYVGFGFSPNGKMYPSDVVVGWVKDGVPHFSDCHTVGHFQPVKDISQDWTLLHGEENNFGTVLKFQRPLNTCDDNDTDIVDDTMRIIFAYHPDDPTDDTHMPWHGATRRGAKSLLLLSTSKQYKLPNDSQTKDLVHHQFHIPSKRTTYQCRVYSLEDISTKHHTIKFEAVIQKGHEPFVHHMNVYKCHNYPRKYIGRNFECYTVPVDMMPCGNVVAGWAVGSGPFHFPPNVGLPIGENEKEYAYVIEIHYNNPGAVTDLVDSSGMRFTYTSHLRQYDAGLLTVGMRENHQHIIPPHYNEFKVQIEATKECISKGLTEASLDEIKLFAVWQHAHLLGKGITTRHLRNDVELEPIAEDEHYDFDYQETRLFKKEVPVRKGDSIRVDCTYDSTLRNNITYGGLSTANEMCFSFIYYYPRFPLYMTTQSLLYDTIPGHSSLLSFSWDDQSSVEELANLVETYDWTDDSVRSKFQQDVLNSTLRSTCCWKHSPVYTTTTLKLTDPSVPYQPPTSICRQG
ncbi:DBH-like monooxygenase protein 1 homolog [Mytilus californianus]|uniref:DBH-like monooxygenase protein 1 homolog n=1 Tax=Mytilus californianus TaxID=6549 RepID=UPI002245206B|nr:DBH-like monooxygenase protein 1 homolog [Mytilus californianus]